MRLSSKQKQLAKRLLLTLFFFLVIAVVAKIALHLGAIVNVTTVGFVFLVVVVLSAIFGGLAVSMITAFIATLFFNYNFFEPFGTFRIAAFNDWVTLFTFFFTAIVFGRLTASTRENTRRAQLLDMALDQLKEFGSWLLFVPRAMLTLTAIAENAVRIFKLEYCSIHVYAEGKWHNFSGVSFGQLSEQIADVLKKTTDHPTAIMELIEEQGLGVRYAKIKTGADSLAIVAVKSKDLPLAVIDSMASMIGVTLLELLSEAQILR